MKISIEIDTNETPTEKERAVVAEFLRALDGGAAQAESAPDEPPAAPTRRRAVKQAEPEPEPEPDEDLLGSDEYTMQDAVDRATELISAGKQPIIKKALADLGAKRVADLKGDQIREFIEALV